MVERLSVNVLVGSLQHADALLADLGRDHGEFWGPQLDVANTLLAHANYRVAHRVQVKLAAARVNFAAYDTNLLQAIRQWTGVQVLSREQAHVECPACGSQGVATGFRHAGVSDREREPSGKFVRPILGVWFSAGSFACPICGLRLDSSAEIAAAGMEETWDEGPEQVDDYSPPYDEDEDCDRRREGHHRNAAE
jgi:predicted RNA-binding Zn-ribbon protein involved in translation (DUF1610 family)